MHQPTERAVVRVICFDTRHRDRRDLTWWWLLHESARNDAGRRRGVVERPILVVCRGWVWMVEVVLQVTELRLEA